MIQCSSLRGCESTRRHVCGTGAVAQATFSLCAPSAATRPSCGGPFCSRQRPGYTLLELMIVLAILVTLLAVAWPNLRRPLGRGLLREAGQQLAQHVSDARMLAIESGQTLALRFEPGGSNYSIMPAEAANLDRESDQLAVDGLDEDPSATWTQSEEVEPTPLQIVGTLPHDITFVDPLADESLDAEMLPGLADEFRETEEVTDPLADASLSESSEDWSPPILLYSTGRAENAQLLLKSPDGYLMRVTLRGLTGAVTLAKPELETPVDPGEVIDDQSSEPENTGLDSEMDTMDLDPLDRQP